MTARLRRSVLAAGLTLGLAGPWACQRPAPPSAADRALADRVTGVWDAELRLDEAPSGAPAAAGRARVGGTLSLLATTRGAPGASPWLPRPATHAGAYDLDVAPLGFALPASGPVATLEAAVAAPDSLAVVLPADASDRALVLLGTVAGDSARGTWTYSGRSVPGWRGTFRLVRRAGAR